MGLEIQLPTSKTEPNYQGVYVPPKGKLSASIAFVGEAPGKKEALKGEPFCGPSGSLLKELIHQNGLSMSGIYLTNVIKEKPHIQILPMGRLKNVRS